MIHTSFGTPLLADGDGIVALIIAVFSVIGWIIKVASGAAEQRAAEAKSKPARRAKTVDEEISIFLEEVGPRTGQRPAATSQRSAPKRAEAEKPRPTSRKNNPAKPQGGQRPPGKGAPQQPTKRTTRPGEDIARRPPAVSADLGQQVQQHLNTYMAERISQQVSSDVASTISSSVAEHLGQANSSTSVAATVYHTPVHPIVAVMQSPTTLRQSMMVSMILAPPVALSRKRD